MVVLRGLLRCLCERDINPHTLRRTPLGARQAGSSHWASTLLLPQNRPQHHSHR